MQTDKCTTMELLVFIQKKASALLQQDSELVENGLADASIRQIRYTDIYELATQALQRSTPGELG